MLKKSETFASSFLAVNLLVRIASLIKKNGRVYQPIKVKSAQKGTEAIVAETNYNGTASLNNFSNIHLCDFQHDNITAVETRFPATSRSDKNATAYRTYLVNLSIDAFGAK